MEGKPNQLYAKGMRSFEQYDEICKYFAEGELKDNNANEIKRLLQLHDVGLGEYLTDKYPLWFDFRTIDGNSLHGTGRRIEMHRKVSHYKLRRTESAGPLNDYIYLIMDSQLNIQNGAYVFALY